jgi:hypothetical protein
MAEMAGMLEYVDPEMVRLIALDGNPEHASRTSVPNINIGVDRSSARLPLDVLLDQLIEVFPQMLEGVNVLDSGFTQLSSGQEAVFIELTLDVQSVGGAVSAYEKMVLFQTDTATVMVTIAGSVEQMDLIETEQQIIIDSVEVTNP